MSIKEALKQSAGGNKSATFPTIGTKWQGKVISAELRQRTDFDTNEPVFWDPQTKTRPQENVVVTIDTGLKDPTIPDDDGHRSVYVKWWGESMKALQDAVAAAGAEDINPGDDFAVEYYADGPKPAKGFPPKLYRYALRSAASTTGLFATAPAAPPAPPAPAAPQLAPVPAPASPFEAALFAPPAAPAAVPAPPAAAVPAPPAAPAAVPAPDMATVAATVKAWQAKGWTDVEISQHADFPYRDVLLRLPDAVSTLAAIRNS